jgi:CDP-diacylglycerol--glycerol-3-phosphate 3-phosphatidyltransferase
VQKAHDYMTFSTTPNFLTLTRILFVPVVVGCLMIRDSKWDVIAGLIFAAASITDYFDGYLARVLKEETIYGKLMDPLADKFLVVSSLIMLQDLGRIHPIVVILLICREMAITGLRALASAEGVIIGASTSAKWKTATQMVAIPLIMAQDGLFGIPFLPLGMVLLYISLGISMWSAKDYVVSFFQALKESRKVRVSEKKLLRQARLAAKAARAAARARRFQT